MSRAQLPRLASDAPTMAMTLGRRRGVTERNTSASPAENSSACRSIPAYGKGGVKQRCGRTGQDANSLFECFLLRFDYVAGQPQVWVIRRVRDGSDLFDFP